MKSVRRFGGVSRRPYRFDSAGHTQMHVGFTGALEVLSAYRSPHHQRLAGERQPRRRQRQPAHQRGNAMDISMPGVPAFKVRQVARSRGMGSMGFYPRSGFVHIDTGPVRYW
jgi:uncharacterized protein YcbK (DUF882 family)